MTALELVALALCYALVIATTNPLDLAPTKPRRTR
jgi:hypothetical protein